GVTPKAQELDVFGDFVYLVVADNVPFPLNLPPEVCRCLGQDDPAVAQAALQQAGPRLQWPTPFWADDGWPFVELDFHPVPREAWPMSHIKPGLGELKFLNWAYSFLAGKIKNACRDFIAVAKSAGEELKENIRVGRDYTILEVEAIHDSIDKVVKRHQHPPFHPDIHNAMQH